MNNFINNNVKLYKISKLALKYKATSFNILTDICKKKFFNQKVPSFPKVITLYVTNKCNLHCAMCLNVNYRKNNQATNEINEIVWIDSNYTQKGIALASINQDFLIPELKKSNLIE